MQKKLFLLLLAIISFSNIYAENEDESKIVNMDPKLYSYYNKSKLQLRDPKSLSMFDTLFTMAGKLGDKRTQAVALSQKMMHYYYTNGNEDSLAMHLKRVKDFSKKNDQMTYYYWAWMKYADFFSRKHEYNKALLELQKMKNDALARNNDEGIINSYKALSRLYNEKGSHSLAIDNIQKAITIVENTETQDFNLSSSYLTLADYYLNAKKYSEAKTAIDKAEPLNKTTTQKAIYLNELARYAYETRQRPLLIETIKTLEGIKDRRSIESMAQNKYYLAMLDGNYSQALQYNDSLMSMDLISKKRYWLNAARINATKAGDMATLNALDNYVLASDSIERAYSRGSIEEFNSMLNLHHLDIEKKNMQIKYERDRYSIILICMFVCALMVVVLFFILLRMRLRMHNESTHADLHSR